MFERLLKNRFLLIALILVLFITGFSLGAVDSGQAGVPAEAMNAVFTPVRTLFSGLWERGGDIVNSIAEYERIREENEALRLQIAEMEGNAQNVDNLIQENEELRRLAGFVYTHPELNVVGAEVISGAPSGMFHMHTINRGANDGIKAGDAVVTPDGLVGTITETGNTWSRFQTILDPGTNISATTIRTNTHGFLTGDAELARGGQVRMTHLDAAAHLRRGDLIETAGGVGLNLPRGLRIGRIEARYPEPTGVSQYAVVTPAVDFNNLRLVMVIIDYES